MVPRFDHDGGVVIQAGRTQFRVHRSILTKHSLKLEEMMMGEEEKKADGFPVLHVSDSVEDMRHLLKALYDRRYFQKEIPLPFEAISSMVRLGKKYEIAFIYDEAVARLTSEFPATLELYDANPDDWSMIDKSSSPSSLYFDIIMARETDNLSILPLTFYNFIVSNVMETIINGARREDGSLAVLSVADLRACFLGLEAVRLAQTKYTFSWLADNTLPSEGCHSLRACSRFKSS